MKSSIIFGVALVAIALSAGFANAEVMMQDNFDSYNLGNLVPQDSWTAHSGAGLRPVQVVNSTLSVPGLKAIQLVQASASGEDVNKPIGRTMAAPDVWYSGFDVKVDGAAPLTTADYFAHFLQGTSNYSAKVFLAPPVSGGGDFTFAIQGTSGTALTNPLYAATMTTNFAYGTTHRVVTALDYSVTPATCKLWIDPVDASSPYLQVQSQYTNANTAYAFRQGSLITTANNSQTIDNLVVATTFAEAAAVPEPGTFALLGCAFVAVCGFAMRRMRNR